MPAIPHVVTRAAEMRPCAMDDLSGHARGLTRIALLDGNSPSVHAGYHIGELDSAGEIDRCLHAFEKGFYVLSGELRMERAGELISLAADDYALVSPATPYALGNTGKAPARWVEVSVPQPKLPGGWQDTFFVGKGRWATGEPAELGDPRTRLVGRNDRRMPPGAHLHGDLRGFSIKRFIDREFGASHFTMFSVEFANGGICNHHDHPFEEAYLILDGSVDVEFDGRRYVLQRGDFAWTGVGSRHAFFPVERRPVRWLEIQAPQPPTQFGMRWHARWEALARRSSGGAAPSAGKSHTAG
jgi:mannose-6-phosphate isomerase-like protein (cupin superfamily)